MTRKRAAGAVSAPPLPHSWGLPDWPPSVFPGDVARARYLFRMNQRDLLAEGACARIGRSIVFFGEQYNKFLRKRAARVPDYEIAANQARGGEGQ
jgi:hypothetical protein